MDGPDLELYRRSSLIARGYTDRELRGLRRRGRFTLPRRGAYLVGPRLAEAEAWHRVNVHAALSQLGDGVVISHLSAAVLHGLPTWGVSLDTVNVTRSRRSGGRKQRLVHVRTARLEPADVVMLDGVLVTSAARTVVDIARCTSFAAAVVVADAALARCMVTSAELLHVLSRCRRWPGSPHAQRVIAFADGRAESVGESRSRVAIALAGLPRPEPQWVVHDAGGRFVARTDFGWNSSVLLASSTGSPSTAGWRVPAKRPVTWSSRKSAERTRCGRRASPSSDGPGRTCIRSSPPPPAYVAPSPTRPHTASSRRT